MLKILQARLEQYTNCELQMFKLVLEKAEEPEIKLPTSAGSWKKQAVDQKDVIVAAAKEEAESIKASAQQSEQKKK